jgi:hypothetical protein
MMIRCAALLLSVAFAGAPMVADYCTVSCEAAHSHSAAASPAHAVHHHAANALSISQPPQPCGHDHHRVIAITAASDVAHVRPLTTVGDAVLPASLLSLSGWAPVSDLPSSNSPPGTALRGFVAPIRI